MEGCEFLVAESADGRLDLSDMYVTTDAPTRVGFVVGDNPWGDEAEAAGSTGGPGSVIDVSPEQSYRRPEGLEELQPPAPREYHAVPWTSYWSGDTVKEKAAKAWVWRYYLVPVATREPELRLDFDSELFMLDARSATVRRCEVHRLAPPDTPQHELRLRIRDEVVTIDTGESIPDWEDVVVARKSGHPSLSQLEQQRVQEYLAALEQALQMGTIDEAEFEEAYDVHWLAATVAGAAGVEALGEGYAAVEQAEELETASPEFEPEADIMGGWDEDSYRDLMQDQDDELMEDMDFEDDFDSPAADY